MTEGDEAAVLFEKRGAVAIITLQRPAALNALNLAMRDELWTWLGAARDDPETRAVLIRGAGERAFCAGADVKEFGGAPSIMAARRARQERDVWGLLAGFDKPLVAALHGWALGAGCELSLYCDLRVAADDLRLGLPEVTLGYIPSAGGTQTLPRAAPLSLASEMVLTGEPIDATTALRAGLVHWLGPLAELDATALRLAERLASLPPVYATAVKRALRSSLDLPIDQALAREAQCVALCAIAPIS